MKKVLGRGLESLIPKKTNSATPVAPAMPSRTVPITPVQRSPMALAIEPAEPVLATPTPAPKTPATSVAATESSQEMPIAQIEPDPNQPRKFFEPEVLKELAESIREHGILQPLLVKPLGNERYRIIAGERRFQAAKQIGLTTVPVIVKDVDDNEGLEMAIVENVQRKDLNPVERAMAYQRLIDEFHLTQEEVAHKVGKDRVSVTNSLRLMALPAAIKRGLAEGKITEGHGRALLGESDPQKQLAMYDEIVRRKLSVRQVELAIKQVKVHSYNRALPKGLAPQLAEHIKSLESHFGTKVRLSQRGSAGSIAISFFNPDERDQIIQRLLGEQRQ